MDDDSTIMKWDNLQKMLERPGPFAHPEFEPSPELLETIQTYIKILVVGAGGLGCELLKDLALSGFCNIDVIDMDIIDLSNLNRQFLFRKSDIGKSKAEVAAQFINSRIGGVNVIPHFDKIQDFDAEFYREFHVVVLGLDSIIARRWINGMLVSMLDYHDGVVDQASIIPIVDGGTEGFKGNARVIYPGLTACIECTLDLYPEQINFPLCTIAHTPRLPEHCIEYVRIFVWRQDKPFGSDIVIDGDNPIHIKWIYDKSLERANKYNIVGVTYRLTQGVIKHIIPAVASTNASIAAVCAAEVFKLATRCAHGLSNYMNFSNTDGIYTYTFEAEKRENCPSCSNVPQYLTFSDGSLLQDIVDFLKKDPNYQFHSPNLTTVVNGKSKTLYMTGVKSIEESTKPNLKMNLMSLGFSNEQVLNVADKTRPDTLLFKVKLTSSMES